MTNIVLGAISNYNWDHIKYWVNSLNSCSFTGRKILVCYNVDENTLRKIKGFGVEVCIADSAPDNICVDRFFWYYQLLNHIQADPHSFVVATDVRDVIFQKDPIAWIKHCIYMPRIVASSEGIVYRDEVWGRENFKYSYSEKTWPHVEEKLIMNAGVIAGRIDFVKDLFLNIYWMSRGARYQHVPGGGGPDQAAYNMLIRSKAYADVTSCAHMYTSWAAQLGTTGPQIDYGAKGLLTHSQPTFNGKYVLSPSDKPYAIVHQYDRTPWKEEIERIYG